MDCSRCGGELETYSLGEKEAYVCTDCGFVDTPVEHEATPRPEPEPWTKALERFHEKFVEGDVAVVGSGETAALVEIDDESETGESPSDTETDESTPEEPDVTEADAATDADADADSEPATAEDADEDTDSESAADDADDADADSESESAAAGEPDDNLDGETAEEREKPA